MSDIDLLSLVSDDHMSDEEEIVENPPFIVVGIDYGTMLVACPFACLP